MQSVNSTATDSQGYQKSMIINNSGTIGSISVGNSTHVYKPIGLEDDDVAPKAMEKGIGLVEYNNIRTTVKIVYCLID